MDTHLIERFAPMVKAMEEIKKDSVIWSTREELIADLYFDMVHFLADLYFEVGNQIYCSVAPPDKARATDFDDYENIYP